MVKPPTSTHLHPPPPTYLNLYDRIQPSRFESCREMARNNMMAIAVTSVTSSRLGSDDNENME